MAFETVYSDDQRDAVCHAVLDRAIKPAKRVAQLAASGELVVDGVTVPAFTIPEASVRDMVRKARRRRRGTEKGGITDVPHPDAVDQLRRRLLVITEDGIARMEREAKRRKGDILDGGQITRYARAVRELYAIPSRYTEPTHAPGKGPRPNGAKTEQHPTDPSTIGGKLLHDLRNESGETRAHTPEAGPRRDDTQPEERPDTPDARNATPTTDNPQKDKEDDAPGCGEGGEVSAVGEQIRRLVGGGAAGAVGV